MKKIIITIGKNSQTIFLLIVLVIGLVILLNTIAFFYKKHKNPRFSQKEFLNNIFYKELAGVHSNPRVESVKEGIKLVRDNNLEFILAVGGGSVIDCGKGIAAGVFYEGDVWDLYQRKAGFNKAVPLGAVLTLSATGTEMNGNSVVSNLSLEEKLHIGSELINTIHQQEW